MSIRGLGTQHTHIGRSRETGNIYISLLGNENFVEDVGSYKGIRVLSYDEVVAAAVALVDTTFISRHKFRGRLGLVVV